MSNKKDNPLISKAELIFNSDENTDVKNQKEKAINKELKLAEDDKTTSHQDKISQLSTLINDPSLTDEDRQRIKELYDYFSHQEYKWTIIGDPILREGKKGTYVSDDRLEQFHDNTRNYFQSIRVKYGNNPYEHQVRAVEILKGGDNLIIATPTGSGKSAVFYSYLIEKLSRNPEHKIIIIFPYNALLNEQVNKLRSAIQTFGFTVGVITGQRVGDVTGELPSQSKNELRITELKKNVLVTNPDILQTWLLSNLDNPNIHHYLSKLRLVVLDEVHVYKSVFGSNMAFVLRRLEFAVRLFHTRLQAEQIGHFDPHTHNFTGNTLLQYLTATATIDNPIDFLEDLTGHSDFEVLGENDDTSLRYRLDYLFVNSPYPSSVESVKKLAKQLINQEGIGIPSKFIAFVDSRIAVRDIAFELAADFSNEDEVEFRNSLIYPYVAGQEEKHIEEITEAINNNKFNGVISTSSLEVGIDIPSLNICILYGVPHSKSSLLQRIGRVGRHSPGLVIVINDKKSIICQNYFKNPEQILKIKMEQPRLYLENPVIHARHTVMLMEQNMEYSNILPLGRYLSDTKDKIDFRAFSKFQEQFQLFPKSFYEYLKRRVEGFDVLQSNFYDEQKTTGGNKPHINFSVRNIETQYELRCPHSNQKLRDTPKLTTMTKSQYYREAYPGAIIRLWNKTYRSYASRTITDEYGNRIYIVELKLLHGQGYNYQRTVPNALPSNIVPSENSFLSFRNEKNHLFITKSTLKIDTYTLGYHRFSGNSRIEVKYEYLDTNNPDSIFVPSRGLNINKSQRTTGVCIYHPSFRSLQNKSEESIVLDNFLDIFLTEFLIDRNDVNAEFIWLSNSNAKHQALRAEALRHCGMDISPTAMLLVIYDNMEYGLNLSSKLFEQDNFHKIIDLFYNALKNSSFPEKQNEFICIKEIYDLLNAKGIEIRNYLKDAIIQTIAINSRCYRIRPNKPDLEIIISDSKVNYNGDIEYRFINTEGDTIVLKANEVSPIEGVTEYAQYDLTTQTFLS